MPGTNLFAHTGGKRNASHPEETVLELLKDNASPLSFDCTDRNGIVAVVADVKPAMIISQGWQNDFTTNKVNDQPAEYVQPELAAYFPPTAAPAVEQT